MATILLFSALMLLFTAGSCTQPLSWDSTVVLQNTASARQYQTLVLMAHLDGIAANKVDLPKIILTAAHGFYLKAHFNSEILAVVGLNNIRDLSLLPELAIALQHVRSAHVIYVVRHQEIDLPAMTRIFKFCLANKMLNVAILPTNSSSYYSYKPWPILQVVRNDLRNRTIDFPDQLQNLQGHPLRTYPDQLQPRSLLFRGANSKIQMVGYVGRLVTMFAQLLNATLTFAHPVKIGTAVFFTELLQMTQNATLDIPASIACPNEAANMRHFSHYVEISKWFPMLPVADTIPARRIYIYVFTTKLAAVMMGLQIVFSVLLTSHKCIFWPKWRLRSNMSWLLFNDKALLGLIGSSYPMHHRNNNLSMRLLFVLLFLSGLIFSTMSSTTLATFVTYPPMEAEVNSFDDLRRRNLSVLMSTRGSGLLEFYRGEEFVRSYGSLIHLVQNISSFIAQRNSFNRSMAYATSSSLWSVYEQQQMYFTRKLFRQSASVYFSDFMLLALPLPENSIYEQRLNSFIDQLHASGILNHWYRSSFFDMIKVRLMSFRDYSSSVSFRSAQMDDLYWIWMAYAVGNIISCIVFGIEITFFGN